MSAGIPSDSSCPFRFTHTSHLRNIITGKRLLAREHFVEHRAEGKDVGSFVDFLSLGLLGTHVGHCAEDHADARRVSRLSAGALGDGG